MSAISKTVLVTGGAGFIGANAVRALLAQGYEVTVLDDFSAGQGEYLAGLPVRLVGGSILDRDRVTEALAGQRGVVHLAAQTGVPGSLADPVRDCRVNVQGTLNLLEASRAEAARSGGRLRFVFASSNAPLGRQAPPASEEKAALPVSPYGASKLAGEGYCLAYHGSWQLGTVVLRFANVYGPFSGHKSSVVARFMKDAMTNSEIVIDGDGRQTRDFLYAGDLSRAILRALASDVSGDVFQIATGVETPILEAARLVAEVTGRELKINYQEARAGDIRRNFSSIGKAQAQLGWRPRTELRDGLRATWEWFRSWRGAPALAQEGKG